MEITVEIPDVLVGRRSELYRWRVQQLFLNNSRTFHTPRLITYHDNNKDLEAYRSAERQKVVGMLPTELRREYDADDLVGVRTLIGDLSILAALGLMKEREGGYWTTRVPTAIKKKLIGIVVEGRLKQA